MDPLNYDLNDQMVVSAARQIKNDDIVYVGVGLPMLAGLLAKHTNAPGCTIIIENGIVRSSPFPLPRSTDTLGSQAMADKLTGFCYVNSLGQAGHITTGFLGAGQIDRHGNVNTTVVGDYHKPVLRWNGAGGGNDVMSFCHRTIVIVRQSKRRFPEKVDFVTTPGYFDGKPGWREAVGMRPGTGPSSVVTNLGIYGFENGEMVLQSVHTQLGVTLEQVKAEVGWDIKVSSNLQDTVPPTAEELRTLREKVDPQKLWVGGKRVPVEDEADKDK